MAEQAHFRCTACGHMFVSGDPRPPCPRGCRYPFERPTPRGDYVTTAQVPAPVPKPEKKAAEEAAPKSVAPQKPADPAKPYTAKHKGRGKWMVIGLGEEPIHATGLDKDAALKLAEHMNAGGKKAEPEPEPDESPETGVSVRPGDRPPRNRLTRASRNETVCTTMDRESVSK